MDETIRVEWRDSPERDEAIVALCRQWAARSFLYWTLAATGGLLMAFVSGSFSSLAGIGIPCAVLAYLCGSIAWSHRARVDRSKLAAWNAAARTSTESFREPATPSAEDEARWLSIDVDGVSYGARTGVYQTMRWAGVKSVRLLRDGHVLFLARSSVGFFVPSWAFEADAQRAMVIEHARARLASAPTPPVPEEASELGPQEDAFEVAAPMTWELARLQFGPASIGNFFLYGLLGWVLAVGIVSIEVVPSLLRYLLGACVVIAALVWASPWRQAFLSFPNMKAHIVHRVRFSELGVAIASALMSRTAPWSKVTLAQRPDAIVVDGLVLPRALFEPEQVQQIFRWKGPIEPAPPATPVKSPAWRSLTIWVVLILLFVAAYQLFTNPREEEAGTPRCVLPLPALPGAPLADQQRDACSDLIPNRVHSLDQVVYCGTIDDPRLDRVAVATLDTWTNVFVRLDGTWRIADRTRGVRVVAARALDLVHGGTPEILLVTESTNADTVQRWLTLCGDDDGASRCWWTLPLARSHDAAHGSCQGYRYDVALGDGGRLSFSYAEPPSRASPLPEGTYTIDELVRFDACPAPEGADDPTRTVRRCPASSGP